MVRIKARKSILTIATVMFAIGIVSGSILIYRHIMIQRELEATMEAERVELVRVAEAYVRINYSFGIGRERAIVGVNDVFRPYPTIGYERNNYGINFAIYLLLQMYYHRAGIYLAHEAVVDYLAQEFETDGSRRLYNNGKHPEIEAFVEWMWGGQRSPELEAYIHTIHIIYLTYCSSHKEYGFVSQDFVELSPQMLRALARAEADPDYILDLTSLQQQGY